MLDTGPDDRIDHVYRVRSKVKYAHLELLYPNSTFDPQVMQHAGSDNTTDVLEVVCRDYSLKNQEAYLHYAICMTTKTLLHKKAMQGVGSNTYVCFRWTKCDGVVNPDTIQLVPGSIIPKAMGSNGLQPIQSAGKFDVAQLVLSDMRLNIKNALYNDMLGNPDRTPASATEVAERMADLSRRMGAAFGRLQSELYILKKQGRIELPTVNGREVKIRATSPLAQAQANQDITTVARFLEMVGGVFGPEMLQLLIDGEESAIYLAKKFGVPERLIRDKEQRKQIAALAQQAAQQQQQQGIPVE